MYMHKSKYNSLFTRQLYQFISCYFLNTLLSQRIRCFKVHVCFLLICHFINAHVYSVKSFQKFLIVQPQVAQAHYESPEQHYPTQLINYSYSKKIIRHMEKYSLLTKLAMYIEYRFEAYLQRLLVFLCILTALQTSQALFKAFFGATVFHPDDSREKRREGWQTSLDRLRFRRR